MIMAGCAEGKVAGYLAAHSIPNLFYILRKTYTQKERRMFIKNLSEILRISELNETVISDQWDIM